ncbi:MAG: hypothetical protein IPK32_09290 [Verrucomicrobiaceae bacterium]|nr:hypothetical protein [Verrucomicrobiaceae bacterium]
MRTADGVAKQGSGSTDKGAVRLQLPYQPPEEYDFEVEFTAVAEQQSVGQILSAQSRAFSWIMAGNKPEAPMAGFELFDNGPTSRPSEAAAPMERNLEKGRRHVSRVEVRKAGLRGFLNGVELVNWSGDFKRLAPAPDSKLRDDNHLGLRAARNAIFHKITVREITGTGKVDAGVSATTSVGSSGATVAWTDWLGPRLAKGQFANRPDLVVEKDGITTNQLVTGIPFDKGTVVRGPVRMTYLLRESEGTQFVFSIDPLTYESYRAEDKGSELRLFRCGKDGANQTMLASEKIPAAISRTAERTLEFRVDGNVLRATVNGTFSLSAQDTTLATVSGSFYSIYINKGLLLKKVEIAD